MSVVPPCAAGVMALNRPVWKLLRGERRSCGEQAGDERFSHHNVLLPNQLETDLS